MSVIQQTIAYICLLWGFYCCSLQQTNTADMLDEAVEYVKFLQKQIQVYTLTLFKKPPNMYVS